MNKRQLSKLGIDDAAVPAALAGIQQAAAAGLRGRAMKDRLQLVASDPALHLDDLYFGPLAQALVRSATEAPAPRREPVEYQTWGAEHIDEMSHQQMRDACALPNAVAGALMPDAHVGYGLPIGGVLAHAPELMAWYAPTINSYRRTRSKDAAGWGQTWGVDHRFVSVRVVGHSPRSLRLEFRLPGADTNPYLTLAGVLASVIDGIDARTQPGPPVEGNPFDIDPDAMPHHLGAAAELLAGSDWLRSTFGTDVVDHHATLARFEWSQFLDRVTDWERRRYFDGV